jgi:hypothetical protein
LMHEMTHLRNADLYDNTAFMFAIPKAADDNAMVAGSGERRAKLEALRAVFQEDNSIISELKTEIVEKCGYPCMGKFTNNYLGKMDELKAITPAQSARYRKLAKDHGMDAELIEYDSVINQMALWCHLAGVSESNPGYRRLLELVTEAYGRRAAGR